MRVKVMMVGIVKNMSPIVHQAHGRSLTLRGPRPRGDGLWTTKAQSRRGRRSYRSQCRAW
jgi:hypothetical protein